MMTCEIRINGNLIGVLYMRNVGATGSPENMKHIYHTEYYTYEEPLMVVKTTHKRTDGALELIKKAIIAVRKEQKEWDYA